MLAGEERKEGGGAGELEGSRPRVAEEFYRGGERCMGAVPSMKGVRGTVMILAVQVEDDQR
jgi:hypothetical protein